MTNDPARNRIPTELVSLLLTDVVGSTKMWEAEPSRTALAIADLDEAVARCVELHGGKLVRERGEGDSHFCVFRSPADCVKSAIEIQQRLRSTPGLATMQVRTAIHTGEVQARNGDYYGPVVNRAARIRELCHGGQILVSASTEATAQWNGSSVAMRPLGAHRLRDLAQPEVLFQVVAEGLPETFPPLNSLSRLSNNLPIPISSFIGREDEILALSEMVLKHRLVTVVGTGGSGKTRLSLQVGAHVSEAFPDGTWFVDLSSVDDPKAVPDSIAMALSLPAVQNPMAALIEGLSDGRQLLIVDNCEHLHGACGGVIATILQSCPNVGVLATSRQPVDLAGEHVYRCPGLSLPVDDEVESVLASDAAHLLLDRAEARGTEIAVTPASAASLALLCRRLDGLPLALEMVAGALSLLSPDEVVEGLGRFLTQPVGSIRVHSRQQTMSSTLEWSLSMLDARTVGVLRDLAYFAGSWSMETAEAICAGGRIKRQDVFGLLDTLVHHSLIFADRQPSGKVRFRMLLSTREVLRMKAKPSPSFFRRYQDYFFGMCHDAERLTESGTEAFEDDYPNILAALERAKKAGDQEWPKAAVALRFYWAKSGRYREGHHWLTEAAERLTDEPQLQGRALNAIGALSIRLDDGAGAIEALQRAEKLLSPFGGIDLVKLMLNLAILQIRSGDFDSARSRLEACVRECQTVDCSPFLSIALVNLGVLGLIRQEIDEQTLDYFVRSAESARRAGSIVSECTALAGAAETQLLRGELRSALEYAQRSFLLGEAAAEPFEFAATLKMLAVLFARRGEPGRAAILQASGGRLEAEFDLSFDARQEALHDQARNWLKGYPNETRTARRSVRNKSKAELFGMAAEIVAKALIEEDPECSN